MVWAREKAGADDGTETVGIGRLPFVLLLLIFFCVGWGRMAR